MSGHRLIEKARAEHGAVATEYVIMITLIAGVIIAVVFIIGGRLEGFFRAAAEIF